MAKYENRQANKPEKSIADAQAIARATQKPGQSKEQTKLIAQGIQKGIEQYKKQHKAKARELNKRLKSSRAQPLQQEQPIASDTVVIVRQHWLPWCLLFLSWSMAAIYWLLY